MTNNKDRRALFPLHIPLTAIDKKLTYTYIQYMVTVGVQKLQDQLSWYLAKVKIGERVLITQHNQPIAELIQPQTDVAQDVEEDYKFLYKLASEGRAVLAKRFESTAEAPKIAHEESVDIMTLLNETRADRF